MEITLRPATPADISLLEHWDKQEHNIAADPNDDWNWAVELARCPAWRKQLVAELDGRPVGFLQVIDPLLEETHYWGNVPANCRAIDIWMGEKEDIGKGYGTAMMQLAIERCFSDASVNMMLIDPLSNNTKAHRFYERLGFQFLEERVFGEDHCFVYKLTRENWFILKATANS